MIDGQYVFIYYLKTIGTDLNPILELGSVPVIRSRVVMEIEEIDYDFSVCKVTDYSFVDLDCEYCFIGKTNEERSLICITENVPPNIVERNDGWKAFRICGVLDFSLIGIIAEITGILTKNKIGICAVSTFNTDYVLTKKENYRKALNVLETAGYKIVKR